MYYQYTKYGTVITFQNDKKNYLDLPSITLCTSWFKEVENQSYSAIEAMHKTRNATNDWIFCTFEGNTIAAGVESGERTDCSQVSPVVMTRTGRWNNKCYTFFSQLNRKNKSDDHFRISQRNGVIGISILLKNNSNWMVDFTLHSPLMVPPLKGSDFMLMEAGKWYRIVFTRTIFKLLKSPWYTNCTEYGIESKMGYVSQSECYTKCLTQERKNVCNCLTLKEDDSHRIDWMSAEDYFCEDEGKCPQNNTSIFKKCDEKCPKECLIDNFEYFVSNQKYDENTSISIHLWHSHAKGDTIITHSPEMEFGVFVANIGGLAGIWLGFSAIAFYDKIVFIFYKFAKYFNQNLKSETKTSMNKGLKYPLNSILDLEAVL